MKKKSASLTINKPKREPGRNKGKKRALKGQRDALRREKIVEAARNCVIAKGFHGASVDMIAKAAQINAGQLYRCFRNKEAVMEALVKNILAQKLKILAENYAGLEWFAVKYKDDRAIMAELRAEGMRNPSIALLLKNAKIEMHANLIKSVLSHYPGLSGQQASARAGFLLAVIIGISNLRANEPALANSAATLANEIMPKLFPPR